MLTDHREPIAEARPAGDRPLPTYRPHLDGLRALAVYLVVLFHAGIRQFSGGFIGVDVFFVLSGFLVTRMLLQDLEGQGHIRLSRFYARRFRRLLPASIVVLVITAIAYSAVAGPGQAAASIGAFRASSLYVANWFFIHASTGYFGAEVAHNPILHFWSLAIEEQFYLFWPLILASLFAVANRGKHRPVAFIRRIIAMGAVASLGWAFLLSSSNPDRAYYGTDARAYQLMFGALLALAPGLVTGVGRQASWARLTGSGATCALVLLATSALPIGPIGRGALASALTVIVLASLEAAPSGPLHRVLVSNPLVYLGKISYGIYLWHWPVIAIALLVASPSPTGLLGITLLLATALASLSYHLVEMPVRAPGLLDRHRLAVIASGLTVSIVGGLFVLSAILDRSDSTDASSTALPRDGFTPVPANLDLDAVYRSTFGTSIKCSDLPPSDCTIVHGTGKHILLMGDSNAVMFIPAFTALAEQNDLTLSLQAREGCPWQRGLVSNLHRKLECDKNRDDAYDRVIPALNPDVIVLVNIEFKSRTLPFETVKAATLAALPQLEAPGRTVVLVEPLVRAPAKHQPLACLQKAKFLEDCRFVGNVAPSAIDLLYRKIAKSESWVRAADFDRLACPYLPICDPVIGGHVVRWDGQHLAADYAATLGDELAAWFRANRLIP